MRVFSPASIQTTRLGPTKSPPKPCMTPDVRHPISILGPRLQPGIPDRLTGYRRVCGDELPDDRVLFTGWDATAGFSAMMQLLDTHDDIDGLLAGSDRIAVGAIEAIQQRGLTVPDDIAVVEFDDHPIAERCDPPLTTVQQPLREGSTAANLHAHD